MKLKAILAKSNRSKSILAINSIQIATLTGAQAQEATSRARSKVLTQVTQILNE